ncbi:fumarylacetoacetate hydrolase family protein [Halorussus amylolyticus]|uniref:fumarylacetoacetate hydrolase family protein n=1 Tax=Halorussus amylolyticus TaxID=1126242 RepID=UPI00138F69C3|nr:fumarylacetoacetate hydrolase family protein [Halorussus amylolyticus]
MAENGTVADITDGVDGFTDALETVTGGDSLPDGDDTHDADDVEYLPPTTPTNTVFAAALNYHSHIEEVGKTDREFEWPLLFMKTYGSLVGHEQPIAYHRPIVERLDYEGELAAVIGEPAWQVDEDEALDYVAGYTVLNDVTARNLQRLEAGDDDAIDWFSSKNMARTTPVGPEVVTTDEVGDPNDLHVTSRYNGDVMQDEDTDLMIYDTAELVSFASSRVELQPGDVIATGTPEGVGEFQDISMEEGDTIEVEVEGVGTLSNTVGSPDE